MARACRRRTRLVWLALSIVIALAACGDEDDGLGEATTPTATTIAAIATVAREASPVTTVTPVTPSATPTIPATATEQPATPTATAEAESSPSVPWVDTAPLDNPALGVGVYWLGEQFDPDGELPPLSLVLVRFPSPPGSRVALEYAVDEMGTGVVLQLMHRGDWDNWAARDPASDDSARVMHMFWDSPCMQQETVELEGGQAVIYSSYQSLASPNVTECPSGPFDRFLAHVFFGETVVLINAPQFLEDPSMPGFAGPYNSPEGMRLIVGALRLREPVAEPMPPPTPAASLNDPGSLVLQPADLPGRYGYGDDGCSPRYECAVGPTRFSSEGGYGELSKAGGEFLAYYYQYEHVGFSSGGTPDPNIEPPRIDSFALVCVRDCDPAAVLEVGGELLRYYGHGEATQLENGPAVGDEVDLYQVDTLVFGTDATGYAVIWRHGPVVGMVVIGGVDGDAGRELTVELATKQAERIARAIGQ